MSDKKINVENPEEPNYQSPTNQEYRDDEGKCEDDPRTGTSSKFYNDRAVAQTYLKTPLANAMDDTNKKAMKVWANKGSETAVKYMMHQAGGDYARMRSMYG